MKRTDITGIFPNATDEQIKELMSINGADINNARRNADDLQTQLDAANSKIKELSDGVSGLEDAKTRAEQAEKELNDLKTANAIREIREKVSKDTGVPIDLLTAASEEECAAQATAIKEFARPSAYPQVKDSGEIGGISKPSTRDQFAEWFSKQ